MLAACGGGSGTPTTTPVLTAGTTTALSSTATDTSAAASNAITPIPTRITNTHGALLDAYPLSFFTLDALNAASPTPAAQATNWLPRYAVHNYRIEYLTTNTNGQLLAVSGLVAVPQKAAGFSSPLLAFQHGTTFYDREAPSNEAAPAPSHFTLLASQGYVVMAADYIGYGKSHGTAHPYLQAGPSANTVADMLAATRQWLAEQRILTNGQLFLTGYSEGAYVTLATHRELEAAGIRVTATVAGAGPYDLPYTLKTLFSTANITSTLSDSLTASLGLDRTAAKSSDEIIVDFVMDRLIPNDSDILFDHQFLMDYQQHNDQALLANSVYDWRAIAPVLLTHGRQDEAVPFANTPRTLAAMQTRGSTHVMLEECGVQPSTHVRCILPYLQSMGAMFATWAQDL